MAEQLPRARSLDLTDTDEVISYLELLEERFHKVESRLKRLVEYYDLDEDSDEEPD